MSRARTADVVIPLDDDSILVVDCLRAVLDHDRETLGSVFVIDGRTDEALSSDDLSPFASDPRLTLIDAECASASFAELANLGLKQCRGDAVVIIPECEVGAGWLAELAAVAHLEERTACVSPISNATDHRLPRELDYLWGRILDADTVKTACAPLPRSTTTPVLSTACAYFRGDLLPAVGLFDETLATHASVLSNWMTRAQSLGFMAKRANHVYVPSHVRVEREEAQSSESSASIIALRQPPLERQVDLFRSSLECRMVDHAVRLAAGERLRLAYDLRHLPIEMVGTRTIAVSLARALAELPEIDLTLLVRTPAQARGLAGRVVTADQWADDVQVIHRPAQVVDPQELALLFQSSAHLVVTYLDLIGYRTPLVFASDQEYESYRSTSNLCLPAMQRVVAMSENAADEIMTEFGIPAEDVSVVPLGVESVWFSERSPRDAAVRRRLKLPAQYFFSLATDFPHKNLQALLEAHGILRGRWPDSSPPTLILAGYKNGGRFGIYPGNRFQEHDNGVVFLGPVSPEQLRVLYQDATALVYPSLYEGFGLPPLEAMAAGAPVITMPISSVPEVAGQVPLYVRELSALGLAEAMERVALDPALRLDLRTRGLKHVEQFRWDRMARAMLEVYRSVVLNPSSRSLTVRRLTSDGIVRWSGYSPAQSPSQNESDFAPPPLGIKNAWRALNRAFQTRLKREFRRSRLSRIRDPRTMVPRVRELRDRLTKLLRERLPRPLKKKLQESRRTPDARPIGRWLADGRPVFLLVSHRGGGGTERHVREMAAALTAEGVRPILVSPKPPAHILWEERDANGRQTLLRVTSPDRKSIMRLVKAFKPVHAHIHHLMGMPHAFVDLLSGSGIPYDWTIHDYHTFCPRAHLNRADGYYCGEPDESACDRCITRIGDFFGQPVGESIASWRARSGRQLAGARLIFVPSEYVQQRMERRFPDLPYVVRAHPENPPVMESLAARPLPGHPVRVAVIGHITPAKGLKPLLACARAAEEQRLPLEFIVVGTIEGAQEQALPGTLKISGPYYEHEVFLRLAELRCHLVFLPSVFPETFMYTLSIAMSAKLYTVCFDIGAQAERLRSWGWGDILPLEADPSLVNQSLLAASRKLECADSAPRCQAFAQYPDFLHSYYNLPAATRDSNPNHRVHGGETTFDGPHAKPSPISSKSQRRPEFLLNQDTPDISMPH